MYLLRVWDAIVRPRRLAKKIQCTHDGTVHSQLIAVGMDKMFWCSACRAHWFAASGNAA